MTAARIIIATAGWTVTRDAASFFPKDGTHLARYARRLGGVEINSTFYRSHATDTFRRWAASTPAGFRFAVKMPGAITHELGLRNAGRELERFYGEISGLGRRRGPVLVQLPKSHVFDRAVAARFFARLRTIDPGAVVCEPRHESWFGRRANDLLTAYRIARVAADPIGCPGAGVPAGWPRLIYYRLHGTPRMYWSSYTSAYISALAETLCEHARHATVWCVFDNTAWGAAILNALELARRVNPSR